MKLAVDPTADPAGPYSRKTNDPTQPSTERVKQLMNNPEGECVPSSSKGKEISKINKSKEISTIEKSEESESSDNENFKPTKEEFDALTKPHMGLVEKMTKSVDKGKTP